MSDPADPEAPIEWIIDPGKGIGPLRFSMSQRQVGEVLGPAEKIRRWAETFRDDPELSEKAGDAISEYRIFGDASTMKPTVTYRHSRLVSVDFTPVHDTLQLADIPIFAADRSNVLSRLYMIDRDTYYDDASYIFRTLGVTMAEPEEAELMPGVNVFAPGDMDQLIRENGLQPIGRRRLF